MKRQSAQTALLPILTIKASSIAPSEAVGKAVYDLSRGRVSVWPAPRGVADRNCAALCPVVDAEVYRKAVPSVYGDSLTGCRFETAVVGGVGGSRIERGITARDFNQRNDHRATSADDQSQSRAALSTLLECYIRIGRASRSAQPHRLESACACRNRHRNSHLFRRHRVIE